MLLRTEKICKYFGGLIKGIFTDEPSPGYAGRYCEKSSADMRLLSWYPGIEEDYEKLSGAPMRQDLDAPHFTELHHQRLAGDGDPVGVHRGDRTRRREDQQR